jgi:hypothetical protein
MSCRRPTESATGWSTAGWDAESSSERRRESKLSSTAPSSSLLLAVRWSSSWKEAEAW